MSEADRLDMALYGQVLKGKGPWPQGPKALAWRKLRQSHHDRVYGAENKCPYKGCPVCRPVKVIKGV